MRLDSVFRLSMYLTLAMATLCLGAAEETLLPGMMLFLIPIGVLLLIGYQLEGRWSLSADGSNLAAVGILVGTGVWIAYNLMTPPGDWLQHAPWPAALLPFGGPILMLLMLAKVFRPKKDNDFWMLQVIALIEVALACVLAEDPVFGALFLGYLGCVCWSLMAFYHCRELRKIQEAFAARVSPTLGATGTDLQPRFATNPAAPWPRLGIGTAGRRTVVLALLAFAIFFLTPRISKTNWHLTASFGPLQRQTGFAELVDVNRIGAIQVSQKLVFEVKVENANGGPVNDLTLHRWRGTTLDSYERGRWNPRQPAGSPSGAPFAFFEIRRSERIGAVRRPRSLLHVHAGSRGCRGPFPGRSRGDSG